MSDKIIIEKLKVFAHHGVFPEETRDGQDFYFTAELMTDIGPSGRTDDLTLSTHYGEVCHFIKAFNETHTYQLIEALAENLAEAILLEFPLVRGIRLRVDKPSAPIGLPFETVAVEVERSWHRAFLAMGSNIGDSKALLDEAVEKLRARKDCSVKRVASYLVTKPYGVTDQPDFLNSALEMETLLTPDRLLLVLHEIEAEAGRERLIHWGPRTLDLDILFYDDAVIDTEDLHIPHIDLQNRDFVLIPMNEIAPYLRHPVLNLTISQLKEKLNAE